MSPKFTRKLYLFGDVYDEAIERIFGIENIEIHTLTPATSLQDKNAERLNNLIHQFYQTTNLLVIVNKYQNKLLTILKMSGIKFLAFKVDRQSLQKALEDWHDTYETFLRWNGCADDFLSSQEIILNDAEIIINDNSYGNMCYVNSDIVEAKDNYETLFCEGFKDALDSKFRLYV